MNGRNRTVLLTGATGFIGLHCAVRLLEEGYRVRGTIRSRAKEKELRETIRRHVGTDDRLEVVVADLTADDGWREAADGCTYAHHVASPLPRTPPRDENEIIIPAREGTLRVLGACSTAGVERVVMTSSMAAILYGNDRSQTFDESHWSNVDSRRIGAYEKSKTLAEQAAWRFVETLQDKNESAMELVVINPGIVFGPILSSDWGTSGEAIKKLMQRDFPACPPIGWAPVDARDVADAHLAAMTTPEAAGERFVCAVEHVRLRDVALLLDRHFSDRGYKIPTGRLPAWVMRLMALFDRTAALALNDLGVRQDVDNRKIKRLLGWQPRGLEEMVVAMGESLIEYGVVSA